MMEYYEHNGDDWRALAYRKALAVYVSTSLFFTILDC